MKKVLLTTFPSAFLHYGGGEREITLLNETLNTCGIMSDIYGPVSKSISSYNAVIHFSMHGGSEQIIDAINIENVPLILWPNLWFVKEPDAHHIEILERMLQKFKAVIFRSQTEELHFKKYLNLSNKDVIRISPLVSPKFLRRGISRVFQESYSIDNYAIWPGIIEPQKNQLSAVRAFNDIDCDLVISGRVRDRAYAELCVAEAGGNIHFIPTMPFGSELHLSALAYSKMVVELPLDFPGTSAVEAAAMGCHLLLARSKWTEEILGDCCIQVDPCDSFDVQQKAMDILKGDFVNHTNKKFTTIDQAIKPLVEYIEQFC
jgi:glycosyltransferase involved in cell wall biosynthesis